VTRKELKVFEDVDAKLTEAYDILSMIEEKNPSNSYVETLAHARVQVLLAGCRINHQIFLKEKEKW
jgi:hypothetical protein